MSGFGVEWEHPDGHRHTSGGYNRAGAEGVVARCSNGKRYEPRAVRVMQQTPEGWKPVEAAA